MALVGPANAGKSSLLAALTGAHPKIAPYPFTTIEPQAGMMPFEDVHVQLVDTPAVSAEFMEPWFPELVRRADRVLLVADLGSDTLLDDVETVVRRLEDKRVHLVPLAVDEDTETDVEAGPEVAGTDDEHERVETLVAANQRDRAGADGRLELLREILPGLLGAPLEAAALHVVSTTTGDGLGALAGATAGRPRSRTDPLRGATCERTRSRGSGPRAAWSSTGGWRSRAPSRRRSWPTSRPSPRLRPACGSSTMARPTTPIPSGTTPRPT